MSSQDNDFLRRSLGFRLALNLAVEANPPLSKWIIHHVLRDAAFHGRLEELIITVISKQFPGVTPSDSIEKYAPEQRQALFDAIAQDKHIQLLVSEWIEEYNVRMKVWGGWWSRIDNLLKYLTKEGKEGSEQTPIRRFSGFSFGLNRNPLLPLSLAGALGAGVAGGYAIKDVSNVSKELEKISRISEQNNEKNSVIDTVSKQTESIREVIREIEKCSQERSTREDLTKLTDSWQKALQQTRAHDHWLERKIVDIEAVSNSNQTRLVEECSPSKTPDHGSPVVVKLEGLPSTWPSTFKIAPNYRLGDLPPSSVSIATQALPKKEAPNQPSGTVGSRRQITPNLKVEYPISYEQTAMCELQVEVRGFGDPAVLAFSKYAEGCAVDRVADETTASVGVNRKPVYVPDLDAFVSMQGQRSGLFHRGGYQNFNIAVQAAPYSDRAPKKDEGTKSSGKIAPGSSTIQSTTQDAKAVPPLPPKQQ
jgi:hypothetical protein